jgi:4-amino-4-deoxy-L-arabinose transferase-like glycosyltransferase
MSLLTADRPAATPAHPTLDPTATTAPPHGSRARWERPALIALLVGTGVLYLWGLGESGWANSFYAAAAQAGSESWKAFFFGSSDAANAITVDKTPLSLWPMALSIRVFGLSSWSLLVPQALEGVAAVGLLYATVRRTTGSAAAGLIAGVVLATTPVAVLMFRFDNPDALLTLLLVGSAYATLRAVESNPIKGSHPVRWLALAGALVGLAFLTKMLQAFLVLPALGLVYLLFAHTSFLKRLGHLMVGLGAMIAAAGWWVAIVSLWPASSRPYIGGSQDNSILELTLGYNGFGRLIGDEVGSVGGGGGNGGGMWGTTGIGRMLNDEIGGQIGWLLPTALLLLVAGLWFTRRAARTDAVRANLVIWGGWLLVTAATFSFMAGIFHAYYTVALAPAVGALVGTGAWLLWKHRDSLLASGIASAAVSLTTVLAFFLLGRTSDFVPWLRWVVLFAGLVTALLVAGLGRLPRRAATAVAAAALVVSLAGPTAYAVETAATPHTGSIPSAGPTSGSGGFAGGGGRPGGGFGGGLPPQAGGTQVPGQTGGQTGGGPTGDGAGGLLNGSEPTAQITALLQQDADSYTWVAAAVGSNSASGYQLASEEPVMAIGGFNGSDPSPTLADFQQYVAEGEIHYFISGGGFGGGMGGNQMGGSNASSEIAAWVEENFTATTVDGVTLYDLSTGTTAGSTSGTNA